MDNRLDSIIKRLSDAGMDDASLNACRAALQEEFAGLDDLAIEKKLTSAGGEDAVFDSILQKYNTAKKKVGESESYIIGIDDNMFSDEPEEPVSEAPAPSEDNSAEPTADNESVDRIVSEIDGKESAVSNADEYFNDDADVKVKKPDQKKKSAQKFSDLSVRSSGKAPVKKKKTSIKNMSSRAKTTYIIGLVFLIPLLIVLVMVITVLFLLLYAAVIALVIAFSVALVIVAAVGTALSLMAIVFGVIQLVSGAAAPIGIYEMGLGVTAGGITLGVSILLYNFIVRLAPFLFKKMFVLYKFLFRQLTKLLSFVKGACSKL